jgi:hypothetical protein
LKQRVMMRSFLCGMCGVIAYAIILAIASLALAESSGCGNPFACGDD